MPTIPPQPDNEAQRMARLRELMVLDSAAEPLFDSLARMASQACGVPMGLLSLVDAERQSFKAHVGLDGVSETPRDLAFCSHAIAQDTLFEVADATLDPRFAANPLVSGRPDIRFYAGAPLVLPGGERVGTLCVMDRQPRSLTAAQQQTLRALAQLATEALLMRRDLVHRTLAVRSSFEQALASSEARHRAIVEEQSEFVSLARADGSLLYLNPAYARHFGRSTAELLNSSLYDLVDAADRSLVRERAAWVLSTGEVLDSENRMLSPDGSACWVAWTNSRQLESNGDVLLRSVGRDISARKRAEAALRASEAFLERTGRVAGVGGWELDLRTEVLLWSLETRRIHGVAADYVPSLETAVRFYAPEDRPLIEAAVQLGITSGQPWDLALRLDTRDGRRIWVRAVGEAEFQDGQAVRLIGAVQDITERKQLELQVAEGERFVRLITDSLPVRMAYLDTERRYRFVNQAHLVRFGLLREQVLGRTRSELLHGVGDDVVAPRVDAVLAGQPQRFEFDETVAGRVLRMECQLLPDIGEDGRVRGYFSTGIDITERSAAERELRELAAILDNTTDLVVQADHRGQVLYMNPAALGAVGLDADALAKPRQISEFNTPATNRLFAEVIIPTVQAQGVWLGNTTVLVAGAQVLPVSQLVIAHRDRQGRVARYSSVMRDRSVEVESRRLLLREQATLRSVTEALPAIVSAVDTELRYRFANSAFERWYGLPRDQVLGRMASEVMGPADLENSVAWARRALAGETVQFERHFPQRPGAPHLSVTYVPLRLEDGTVDGFVGIAMDITPHRREQVRLQQLAQRDPLTGLLNRAGFEQQLQACLQVGEGAAVALLYIDLDRFKPVNDQHGHAVGDELLRQFAQRLTLLVRPTDAVARLGGDEFAVLLTGVREAGHASAVGDKVLAAAHRPFDAGALQLHIGASVGVAFGANPAAGASGSAELLARADAELYRAKGAGRGRQSGAPGSQF